MTALSALIRLHPYRLPLRAKFRGLTARDGVLVEGPGGWGEFAPFADYSAEQDAYWLAAAIEAAVGGLPEPVRPHVAVNGILGDAVPVSDIPAAVHEIAIVSGCRTVKVKVGRADDAARVAAVRRELDHLLGPGAGRIRLDANERWDLASARAAIRSLAGFGIEYIEQPCPDAADLAALRRADLGVPIAADESLRRDREFDSVAEFADVAILKVGPLGGGRAVLGLAERIGVPVVISGALESAVGVGRDAVVAAALPQEPADCGLGTGLLLAADVVTPPLMPAAGRLTAEPAVPDGDSLPAAVARQPDQRGWVDRADRAFALACDRGLIPAADLAALGVAA